MTSRITGPLPGAGEGGSSVSVAEGVGVSMVSTGGGVGERAFPAGSGVGDRGVPVGMPASGVCVGAVCVIEAVTSAVSVVVMGKTAGESISVAVAAGTLGLGVAGTAGNGGARSISDIRNGWFSSWWAARADLTQNRDTENRISTPLRIKMSLKKLRRSQLRSVLVFVCRVFVTLSVRFCAFNQAYLGCRKVECLRLPREAQAFMAVYCAVLFLRRAKPDPIKTAPPAIAEPRMSGYGISGPVFGG
jgi:hypothetical protein